MYPRILSDRIKNRIDSGKAIVVIGPRQSGKTTLIESVLQLKDYLLLDGDDPKISVTNYQKHLLKPTVQKRR